MKLARAHYSAPIAHPEIPGAYFGSYAVPGKPPCWVTENGNRKVFGNFEQAELAGYRILMACLNRSSSPQVASVRTRTEPRDRRDLIKASADSSKPDINSVFARFGAKKETV
jgi:hypothetical protein